MRIAWLLVLAACSKHDSPHAAGNGSAAVPVGTERVAAAGGSATGAPDAGAVDANTGAGGSARETSAHAALAKLVAEQDRARGPSDRGPPMTHEQKCQMDRDLGGHHEAGCSKAPPAPESIEVAIAHKATFDATSPTADVVAAKIETAYMKGLERCYRQMTAMSLEPQQTLKVAFTIEPTGRIAKSTATSSLVNLEECVAKQLPAWTFPKPTDAGGKPATTRVELDFDFKATYKPGVLGGPPSRP